MFMLLTLGQSVSLFVSPLLLVHTSDNYSPVGSGLLQREGHDQGSASSEINKKHPCYKSTYFRCSKKLNYQCRILHRTRVDIYTKCHLWFLFKYYYPAGTTRNSWKLIIVANPFSWLGGRASWFMFGGFNPCISFTCHHKLAYPTITSSPVNIIYWGQQT